MISKELLLTTIDQKTSIVNGCPTIKEPPEGLMLTLFSFFDARSSFPYILIAIYSIIGSFIFRKDPVTQVLALFNMILFTIVAMLVQKYISEPLVSNIFQDVSLAASMAESKLVNKNDSTHPGSATGVIGTSEFYKKKVSDCNAQLYEPIYKIVAIFAIILMFHLAAFHKTLFTKINSTRVILGVFFISIAFLTEWYIMSLTASKYIYFSGNYILQEAKVLDKLYVILKEFGMGGRLKSLLTNYINNEVKDVTTSTLPNDQTTLRDSYALDPFQTEGFLETISSRVV